MEPFTEIEVPSVQFLEGRIEGVLHLTVVGVGELCSDEYLFTGDTRGLNPNADLGLVLIFVCGVNMTVPWQMSLWSVARRGACSTLTDPKRGLNSLFDMPGGALPGAQADNGHIRTCIEPYGLCNGHWNLINARMVSKNKLGWK